MMLIRIFIVVLTGFLSANSINISADNFEVNNNHLQSKFSGNVYIKKDDSNIKADQIVIKFDKSKKPKSYKATGNIVFNIDMNGKKYRGLTDILEYQVQEKVYVLSGNSSLKELGTKNIVRGNIITVDEKNQVYKIEGDSQNRVEFIYNID